MDRSGARLVLATAMLVACWSGPPPRDHYYRLAPPPEDQTCPGIRRKVVDEIGDFLMVPDDCPQLIGDEDYWWCRFLRADSLAQQYLQTLATIVDYCEAR